MSISGISAQMRLMQGPKAAGAGTIDEIPEYWHFPLQRVNDLLSASNQDLRIPRRSMLRKN